MEHFINAVRTSMRQENWYSGLAVALTLPDICGRISRPGWGSKKRSVDFFDKYLAHIYHTGPMKMQAMTGGDFYALRCAYLHQGEFELAGHNAAETLAKFQINTPKHSSSHLNAAYNQNPDGSLSLGNIQLRVDAFCEEICVAVEGWMKDNKNDVRIQSELSALGKIHDEMRLDYPKGGSPFQVV